MITRSPRTGPGRRRGFGIIEMALSGLLLAAAMTVTVQAVGWVATDRRATARRERAVVEAGNLMERIAAKPFEELTPGSLDAIELPEAARACLPGSTLKATIAAFDDAPPRRRITLEVRWSDHSGRAASPVRLVAWSYRKGGQK